MREGFVLDDAIALIRARPEMYVGVGRREITLVQALVGDALLLGATTIHIVKELDWQIVAADKDWLTAPCRCQTPVAELFQRIVPLPEAGDNAMRSEVLVTAFSAAVVTASPEGCVRIAGAHVAPPINRILPPGMLRSIAFVPDAG